MIADFSLTPLYIRSFLPSVFMLHVAPHYQKTINQSINAKQTKMHPLCCDLNNYDEH